MRRRSVRNVLRLGVLAAVAAVSALALAASGLAYGRADQPIAQVEISANCTNPGYWLCAPQPNGVGLGGVWSWAELDTTGSNATSGSMDFTVAFCDHTFAGSGPHSAGGFGTPGTGQWSLITSAELPGALADGAFPFFDPSNSYDNYYLLDFFPGAPSEQAFMAIVPAAQGHYGYKPANGVTIQTQVAP